MSHRLPPVTQTVAMAMLGRSHHQRTGDAGHADLHIAIAEGGPDQLALVQLLTAAAINGG